MQMNEVVKLTKLTKKAIRYYEEKGLISTSVNSNNGYKNYSQKDVDDLRVIAFLRNIDMSIEGIREYIKFPEKRRITFKRHLTQIDNRINDLVTIKEVISSALNEESIDFYKLNSYLINKQIMNKNYVLKRLASLFPDAYGKFIIMHFGPFMNEPLDNEEKQKAFNEIVEFLDSTDDIDFPKEFVFQLNQIDKKELIEQFSNMDYNLKERCNIDPENREEIEKLRTEIKYRLEKQYSIENKAEYQKSRQTANQLRKVLETSGYYEKFVNNLKIISQSYREYTERLEKINKTLGLEYDEQGNIIINKRK